MYLISGVQHPQGPPHLRTVYQTVSLFSIRVRSLWSSFFSIRARVPVVSMFFSIRVGSQNTVVALDADLSTERYWSQQRSIMRLMIGRSFLDQSLKMVDRNHESFVVFATFLLHFSNYNTTLHLITTRFFTRNSSHTVLHSHINHTHQVPLLQTQIPSQTL